MGSTPTWTLGMRLSCNFVNVYTIVYHVHYTYMCKHAHPQRTSSQGKARVGQKSVNKSASWTGRTRRGRLTSTRTGHADFRAMILAQKSARKSVSVSVLVPWNLSLSGLFLLLEFHLRSVCRSIGNVPVFWKNGWFNRNALSPFAPRIRDQNYLWSIWPNWYIGWWGCIGLTHWKG